jgi:hypothetical protein
MFAKNKKEAHETWILNNNHIQWRNCLGDTHVSWHGRQIGDEM